MNAKTRQAAWGLILAIAYVAVALWTTGPSRPLFDGGAPLQYRWVCPPGAFAATNQPAQKGNQTLPLTATGTGAASIATADGQAAVVPKDGTFAPRHGDTKVVVNIVPSCATPLGPPPAGRRYDGNAYAFTATYEPSGVDAKLTQPATIVLQFPIVATTLLRRDGNSWTDLKASPISVSLQIFTTTSTLGTFVAAGPPLDTGLGPKKKFPAAIVISIGAAVAAVVAGLFARMRAKRRRSKTGPTGGKSKGPPPRGRGAKR